MGGVKEDEIGLLMELLTKYPLESLRKIASVEGLDYYRLKRIYDRYYGKYIFVNAIYNIRILGLKSFVAFLSVPSSELMETATRMTRNPFVAYVNPAFGFKNGLSAILHVPKEQVKHIDEMLAKYSDDFEYYEVRAYPPPEKPVEWGSWKLSYDYAVLMDILKMDARTPMKKIAEALGKTRPTLRFMINRLQEKGILVNFIPTVDIELHDRGILGITSELKEEILEKFREYEITVGYLPGRGYLLEWFFSSKEDMGEKVLEFSAYVEKLLVDYFEPQFKGLNDANKRTAFQRMVKKDGSGYRSILEF